MAGAVALAGVSVPATAAAPAARVVPDGCEAYVPRATDPGGLSGGRATADHQAPGALDCRVHSEVNGRDFPVIVRPAADPSTNRKVALFLDGADSHGVNGWVEHAAAVDRLSDVDMTLVFPVTDPWTWSQDWDAAGAQFETFLSTELPDYLEDSFGVPDGGRGTTGVVGLSAGAYATLNLATKHPEQYSSVYALSGVYDPQSPGGRVMIDTTSTYLSGRERAPWTSEESRARNSPLRNLDRLTMPTIVNVSTGVVHPEEIDGASPGAVAAAYLVGGPVETGTFVMTAQLQAEAVRQGKDNIEFRYDILGGHTWPTWRRAAFDNGTLRTFLDRI